MARPVYKRKTTDRLTPPFTFEHAAHVGKIIFGYDMEGLTVLTLSHTTMTDLFTTIWREKDRSNLVIEFNTYFLPELNQMVTMGYDVDAHVLAFIPKLRHLNILDVNKI